MAITAMTPFPESASSPHTKAVYATIIILLSIVVVLVVVLATIGFKWFFSPRPPAATYEGVVEIAAHDFFAFSINVSGPSSLMHEIFYDVVSQSGPQVDVMFLIPQDFSRYLNGTFHPDNCSLIHDPAWSMPASPYLCNGQYWFVLDNTNYGYCASYGRASVVQYKLEV